MRGDPVAQSRFAALVLAGRRGHEDPVAAARGVSHKCLVPLHGIAMLERVIGALRDCDSVTSIAISIDDPAVLADLPLAGAEVRLLRSAATPSASVAAGIEALGSPFPILVTTADHALLTPAMVDFFCDGSLASGADITAGLTAAHLITASYPATRRTYLRFKDDRYSGSNLFALMSARGLAAVEFWRRVERQRKRPWRLVTAFGARALVEYLLGRLTLDEAFLRISERLGLAAAAVKMPFAEAAIDVDRPADVGLAEEILRARG